MHTFFFFLIKEVCALTPSPSRGLGRGWGKNGENPFVFRQKTPIPTPALPLKGRELERSSF